MTAVVARLRIAEQQDRLSFLSSFVDMLVNACHTGRFNQRLSGGWMLDPCFAQVMGDAYSSSVVQGISAVSVVAHVQHDASVIQFNRHTLCRVGIGGITGHPSLSTILAISDVGKRHTLAVAALGGKHQRSILERDAMPWRWSIQPPFWSFRMFGYVLGFASSKSVIRAFSDEELTGLLYPSTRLRPFRQPLMVPPCAGL